MSVLAPLEEGLITGLHHVELTVSDLDRSIAFYEWLGFRLRMRWSEGPELAAEGFDLDGSDIELAQLDGFGITLELIRFFTPDGAKTSAPLNDVGTAHIALTVRNIDEAAAAFAAAGAKVVSAPIREHSADWVHIEDPDGIRVEFISPNAPGAVPIGAVVAGDSAHV